MLSVRVVGVTDELVSICEGARPALSVEIAVHSETLAPICKSTTPVIVKQELHAWVMVAFMFRIIMSSLTYRSHSETESSSIPDELFALLNVGVACNHS